MATDAKVAHFHLALSVDQNIGGLHIWRGTLLWKMMKENIANQQRETSPGNQKLYTDYTLMIWLPLCITDRLLCRCSNALTICGVNRENEGKRLNSLGNIFKNFRCRWFLSYEYFTCTLLKQYLENITEIKYLFYYLLIVGCGEVISLESHIFYEATQPNNYGMQPQPTELFPRS